MTLIGQIRKLRHGPLSWAGPAWVFFGRQYRRIARRLPARAVTHMIGPYGPFRLHSEFTFSNFANWGAGHNKGFITCIEACRGKTCVFDVGAHVGLVALPAASVLADGGWVHAFEPSDANHAYLNQHIEWNGPARVKPVKALVGASDKKEVPFFESYGVHGQNSIILKNESVLTSEAGGYEKKLRPQISIDAYAKEHGLQPQVIKIDVEGAELGVLEGAEKTIASARPLIILSVHPREIELAGRSLAELKALVAKMGYDIRDVDGRVVSNLSLDEYIVAPMR